ncbi:MAG: hypothetical protein MUD12_08410 [Spirochaetes bacterium]|nr:hypothetical protein [Spirochaetota bacterium]
MQKTIALLCRDLLEELEEMPEFSGLARGMDKIIQDALDFEFEKGIIEGLERALGRYHARTMQLYASNPRSNYLDKLQRRVSSLREMCSNLLN